MAIAVEAPSFPAGRGAWREWPLLRAGLGQEVMAEAGEVAKTAGGEGHEFGIHIGRGGAGGEEVPMAEAAASSANTCQSGRDSPGGGRKAGQKVTRRSELVIVPSFSLHWAAGNTRWAAAAVSLSA